MSLTLRHIRSCFKVIRCHRSKNLTETKQTHRMHVCWEYFVNWHVLISSAFLYPHLVVNTFIDRSVESVHVLCLVTPVSFDTSRHVSFVQTRVYKRLLGRVFPDFLNFAFIDSQLNSINPVNSRRVNTISYLCCWVSKDFEIIEFFRFELIHSTTLK